MAIGIRGKGQAAKTHRTCVLYASSIATNVFEHCLLVKFTDLSRCVTLPETKNILHVKVVVNVLCRQRRMQNSDDNQPAHVKPSTSLVDITTVHVLLIKADSPRSQYAMVKNLRRGETATTDTIPMVIGKIFVLAKLAHIVYHGIPELLTFRTGPSNYRSKVPAQAPRTVSEYGTCPHAPLETDIGTATGPATFHFHS